MITKDQLELLKQSPKLNIERHYTIGGTLETAVHASLDNDRLREFSKGEKTMNEAVQRFRIDMAFKSREGLAKSQFEHSSSEIPTSDHALAESTWRNNHISAHEDALKNASRGLKVAVKNAAPDNLPPVDADMGYGAGRDHDTLSRYVNHAVGQRQALRSESVKAFAKSMKQEQGPDRSLDR
jgi:hypothetical protein